MGFYCNGLWKALGEQLNKVCMYMYVIGIKINYSSCNLYHYPLGFMGEPFVYVSKISVNENRRKVPSSPSKHRQKHSNGEEKGY